MANTFNNIQLIARELLPRLINNLIMPNLMYRDYSAEFAKEGNTIQVEVPPVFEGKTFNRANGVEIQNIALGTVPVTLDKIADVTVEMTAEEMVTNVSATRRAAILDGMAIALAEKINAECMALYKDIPYFVGTAGTTPDSLTDFADARKMLTHHKVPLAGRVAVWDENADAKFVVLDGLVKVSDAGTATALRDGEIGRVFGITNYTTQTVPTHTTGAAGVPAVDLVANYAVGAMSLHVDGLTAAFKVGDLFTIAGITSTSFVVTSASALSTADQDIGIYPPLPAIVLNDALITVIASHVANMVFNKNAFAFVTRPMQLPSDKSAYFTSYNGIGLRVVEGYDQKYKKNTISIDILYGMKTVFPELATIVLG